MTLTGLVGLVNKGIFCEQGKEVEEPEVGMGNMKRLSQIKEFGSPDNGPRQDSGGLKDT
jgi:hypothetical protein